MLYNEEMIIFYFNQFLLIIFYQFNLVGLWTIPVKSSSALSLGTVLRSRVKDMTITIVIINPRQEMGWSVDDVMPRKDGLRIWKILKKDSVEFRPWYWEVGVRPLCGEVGVPTMVWRSWGPTMVWRSWGPTMVWRSWGPAMVWRSWSSDHGVEKLGSDHGVEKLEFRPWHGEVGVRPWCGEVGVRPWCGEVGVPTMAWRSWGPTMVWRSWSSDHGVEKLGSDHGVEKLGSDHGVEKVEFRPWCGEVRVRPWCWYIEIGPRDVPNVGGDVSIVWYERLLRIVSLLVSKNRSQKLIQRSYLNNGVRLCFVFPCIYICMCTLVIDILELWLRVVYNTCRQLNSLPLEHRELSSLPWSRVVRDSAIESKGLDYRISTDRDELRS